MSLRSKFQFLFIANLIGFIIMVIAFAFWDDWLYLLWAGLFSIGWIMMWPSGWPDE